MPMLMAALAAALSLLEEGVGIRGDAAAPVVVVIRELVGDGVVDEDTEDEMRELVGDEVVDDEDAEDEVRDTGEDEDGDEIPPVKDRPGAVEPEAPVDKLVILGPHVCGDMASFDVIVKTGVSVETSPAKSSICI